MRSCDHCGTLDLKNDRLLRFEIEVQPYLPFEWQKSDLMCGFLLAPASTKYHGHYTGGLFDHSVAVMNALVDLTDRISLKWQRPESPYLVGFFHDLCKADSYYTEDEGRTFYHDDDTLLRGHGDKSVMLLSTLTQLTGEEVACIRYHMGAFTDKEEWGDYTRAIHQYPNVLWTHTADMIATHIENC